MAKVPGVKISELAKELGVASKEILSRLKSESLGEAKTHNSTIKFGLAATVRGWAAAGLLEGSGGGVAVDEEGEEGDEPKRKARPRSRKRADTKSTTDEKPAQEETSDRPTAETPAESPTLDEPAIAAQTVAEISAPEPTAPAPPQADGLRLGGEELGGGLAPRKTAVTPAARPASATRPPVRGTGTPSNLRPPTPPLRPAVSLLNRATPAQQGAHGQPQAFTPKPATVQGPRVVRIESPEPVAPPRPRPQRSDGPAGPAGTQQARARGGAGVRPTVFIDDEAQSEEEKKKAAAKKGVKSLSSRRGPDGRRGEAEEKLREFTEADIIARRDALNAAASYRQTFDSHLKKTQGRGTHQIAQSATQKGEPVQIEEPITVKTLSSALGIKSSDIIRRLMQQRIMATVNQSLDAATAEMIALEFGLELRIVQQITAEHQLLLDLDQREVVEANLVPRPPVVTILGHVDHGKTSLLDKIRNANVAAGEAGGITQHTAAWSVETKGSDGTMKRVTFIDTPGHQAFTSMRARGANMTDVVVLVVSAAEGVQPQTIESLNHARAAAVPVVIAMNKIDRPDANLQSVLGQLAGNGVNPVEWGGDVEVVKTSATTGEGIADLIEILDYQTQLLNLRSDPTLPARGVVVEARMDDGLGPIATVLVQDGTLRVGDVVLAGAGYGRIRSLLNDRRQTMQEASASTPVIVSGLSVLPGAGDKFYVVDDLDTARKIGVERASRVRMTQLSSVGRVTAANLLDTVKANEAKTIHLIIKADTQGSIETLVANVTGQNTEEVKVRVIHSGVGPVSESDVELALATRINPEDPQAHRKVGIIAFHVAPEDTARALAEQNHIDIKVYRVIYEIFDDLKKALSGMLAPEIREKHHGRAEVRKIFKASRIGSVAGSMITEGHISRGSRIRLIRNGAIVTEDLTIETLKRLKDDVREVKSGFECGIKLAGYDDIKEGDVFDAYVRETIERTL